MSTVRSTSPNPLRLVPTVLAVVGTAVLALAIFNYVTAQYELAGVAEAARLMNTQMSALDAQQQTALNGAQMALVQRKRRADEQHNTSIILGGIGLILIGAGWLGSDLARRRG